MMRDAATYRILDIVAREYEKAWGRPLLAPQRLVQLVSKDIMLPGTNKELVQLAGEVLHDRLLRRYFHVDDD